MIKAAIYSDSDEAGDSDSAFDFLGDFGNIGHVLFIAVPLVTMSYGIFMIITGYYYSFKKKEDGEDE